MQQARWKNGMEVLINIKRRILQKFSSYKTMFSRQTFQEMVKPAALRIHINRNAFPRCPPVLQPTHILWNRLYMCRHARSRGRWYTLTTEKPTSQRGTYDSWGCLRAPWPKFARLRNPLPRRLFAVEPES